MQKRKWYSNKSSPQQTDAETVAATAAHIVVNIVVSPYAWTSGRCIEHDNILNAPLANSHGPATAPRFHNRYPVIMVLWREEMQEGGSEMSSIFTCKHLTSKGYELTRVAVLPRVQQAWLPFHKCRPKVGTRKKSIGRRWRREENVSIKHIVNEQNSIASETSRLVTTKTYKCTLHIPRMMIIRFDVAVINNFQIINIIYK